MFCWLVARSLVSSRHWRYSSILLSTATLSASLLQSYLTTLVATKGPRVAPVGMLVMVVSVILLFHTNAMGARAVVWEVVWVLIMPSHSSTTRSTLTTPTRRPQCLLTAWAITYSNMSTLMGQLRTGVVMLHIFPSLRHRSPPFPLLLWLIRLHT